MFWIFQALIYKIYKMCCMGVRMTAMYHVLAMALDRMIAIMTPIWHKNNMATKTSKVVGIMGASIILFCLFWSSPRLYVFGKQENGKCGFAEHSRLLPVAMKWLIGISTFGMNLVLPHAIFVVANVVFVQSLNQRKTNTTNAIKKDTNGANKDPKKMEKVSKTQNNQRSYTLMLFMMTLACTSASITIGSINIVSFAIGEKTEVEFLNFDKGHTGFAKFLSGLGEALFHFFLHRTQMLFLL